MTDALLRLQKELKRELPKEILYLGHDEVDPFKIIAVLAGPLGSPYENGKFKLEI